MQNAAPTQPPARATALVRAVVLFIALLVTIFGVLLGAACRSRAGEDGVGVADAGGGGTSATPSGSTAPAASAPAPTTPAVSAGQPASGRTVDVQMVGDATGYRFVPATVTIKAGDAVRWTNVSGGPHNVTFWADSVPSGAGTWLQANMPQATAPLTGPLLMTPNATYTISFAGAQAGTYSYYCMPHLALGMKARIVVQE